MTAYAGVLPLRDAGNLRHLKLGISHTLAQSQGNPRCGVEHIFTEYHNRIRRFDVCHARQACCSRPVDTQRKFTHPGFTTAQSVAEIFIAYQRLQCGIGFQRRPG